MGGRQWVRGRRCDRTLLPPPPPLLLLPLLGVQWLQWLASPQPPG